MDAYQAFTTARFDWTASLNAVWQDANHHVPEIHREVLEELLSRWGIMDDPDVVNPLGSIVLGEAGAGKTHLVGALRRAVIEKGGVFLLGDMTDVRDFWATVNQGVVASLERRLPDGTTQLEGLVSVLLKRFGGSELQDVTPQAFAELRPPALVNRIRALARAAARETPEPRKTTPTINALLLLASSEPDISAVGDAWLSGLPVDEDALFLHELPAPIARDSDRVRALTQVISLKGPMVFAIDQIDAIVSEARAAEAAGAAGSVTALFHRLARGLLEVWDVMHQTLVVATALEANWKHIEKEALASVPDRYESHLTLKQARGHSLASLLSARLGAHYEKIGFEAPHTTYPFKPEAFRGLQMTPRNLLRAADDHRRRCKSRKEVYELASFVDEEAAILEPAPTEADLEAVVAQRFYGLSQEVDIERLLNGTDRELDLLMEAACRCLALENETPRWTDVAVDLDFGNKNIQPLHARIRVIDHAADERERHFSLRFIQHANPIAFQARLKRALTESGVAADLSFRRLTVVRRAAPPSGKVTRALTEELVRQTGVLADPSDAELRTLSALAQLLVEAPDGLEQWLRSARPVGEMPMFRSVAEFLFPKDEARAQESSKSPPVVSSSMSASSSTDASASPTPVGPPVSDSSPEVRSPGLDGPIALGAEVSGMGRGASVHFAVEDFATHMAVVAAAGSGKTVFVRRVIEQSAIRGIPAVVIDVANDLVRLGDRVPADGDYRPDAREEELYFDRTETVVWTPGWEGGNPLSIDPLPDFAPVRSDPDELNEAIELAHQGLVAELGLGKTAVAKAQQAVLRKAIAALAETDGATLQDLVEVLHDPPGEVIAGFEDRQKDVKKLATTLRAAIELNPLLKSKGRRLEFDTLFGLDGPKTRISVINLSGLAGLSQKQAFVGRLLTMMFTWVKKQPGRGGMKGLVAIDEAKDFAPATSNVASRQPLLRLAAQARKYGLGMIVATQEPKSIHNQVVSNCSTQIFGRTLAPAAQEAVLKMLSQLGAGPVPLANLKRGEFYASVVGSAPRKMATERGISHHPANPPSPDEVRALAKAHRGR